ncbi:unnamed protein product, partial [marine sediment metagenome]
MKREWHCKSCERLWDRERSQRCPSCGEDGKPVIRDGNQVQVIEKTSAAPIRRILGVYPDSPWSGMFNCGHQYESEDERVILQPGIEIGCMDCWR